jgi:cytidyltransferase-like protein
MAITQLFGLVEIPEDITHLSSTEATRIFVTIALTIVSYHVIFGNRHMRKRQESEKKKEIRVFMEGAFDLMHFGHMNAFRLGKSLGTHLVVGVNSDESITECKAAPLMNDAERLAMVRSCKFVDEVVPDIPYIMNKEYIDYIFKTYNVDYIIHGDDPCIVDGR